MQKYPVTVNLIPGLPHDLYRNGTFEGVVAHCTANPNTTGGDTPTNERSYLARTWNTPGLRRFVQYFIGIENGQPVILQVADPNYRAWGAGEVANERYVHVELCMYDDPVLFRMAYDAYCFIIAKTLSDRKLGVTPATPTGGGTLWSHDLVTQYLGATDHTDPTEYFKAHGIGWGQFVADVQNYYKWLVTPAQPQDLPSDYARASWDKACNTPLSTTGKPLFDGTNPKGVVDREMLAVLFDRLGLLK
jgi:N-acetylmuramoyl-L-alanine amidase CwlA